MEEQVLRPFFCRIGSKKLIAVKVIEAFPDEKDITTYVEPFIGGGAILWAKEPHQKEVINDLDTKLINGYKLLKSTKARNFRQDLDNIPALQTFLDTSPRGEANELTYGIVSTCNRFGGKTIGDIYHPSNPFTKLKKIDAYQARLKNVVISNTSYEKVIKKYDSPNTFFYCDPPYEESGILYKEYSSFNQEELRDSLKNVKGKWLLSINDSANIRNLYKGFFFKAFIVPGIGGKAIGKLDRKELLIANYSF